MDIKAISKLNRLKEIVLTLIKYGFADLVDRLDFPGLGPLEKVARVDHGLGTPERIRRVLEELGPTFVKFGQIMSLRPDLVPKALLNELSRLQDDVAAVSYEEIREVLEKSLERKTEEVFRILDPEPIAAASLSQVHRGVLRKEGWVVAVKVQRPGIRRKVEQDLDILASAVDHLHRWMEEIRIYNLPELLKLTKQLLINELDFKHEARYMRIARSNLSGHEGILVPEVYEDYCRTKLLVTEYIQGAKLKEIDLHTLEGAEDLARQGLRSAIKQILNDGFFHADPHPGNLLITPENQLCVIDWGMVGRLTRNARYELIDLIHAVIEEDTESAMNMLLMIARSEGDVDRRGMERQLLEILDTHLSVSLREMHLGQLLMDIAALIREYHLLLPSDLGIMIKALVTAEGSARMIYPDLDVFSEAEPPVKELAARRYGPRAIWQTLQSKLSQFMTFQGRLPRVLAQVIDKVDSGKLRIHFEHENLGGLRETLENISNRLTFGIIIAAMIIGSSMIITTGVGPLLFGFPALGVIGYIISAILGLWVVINIIRTKKY